VQEDYVRFVGMEIRATSNSFGAHGNFVVSATSDVRFDEFLWSSTNATTTTEVLANFQFAGTYTLTNCLVVSNGHRSLRTNSSTTALTADHCGFAGGQAYQVLPTSEATFTNCWSIHNAAGGHSQNWYTGGTAPSGSHNASEDTSASTDFTNTKTNITPANEFTNATNDPTTADYTLSGGTDLVGTGTGSETIDITGATRTGSPDIGPFNYSSAASTGPFGALAGEGGLAGMGGIAGKGGGLA
jgi:hypothetical protein